MRGPRKSPLNARCLGEGKGQSAVRSMGNTCGAQKRTVRHKLHFSKPYPADRKDRAACFRQGQPLRRRDQARATAMTRAMRPLGRSARRQLSLFVLAMHGQEAHFLNALASDELLPCGTGASGSVSARER